MTLGVLMFPNKTIVSDNMHVIRYAFPRYYNAYIYIIIIIYIIYTIHHNAHPM